MSFCAMQTNLGPVLNFSMLTWYNVMLRVCVKLVQMLLITIYYRTRPQRRTTAGLQQDQHGTTYCFERSVESVTGFDNHKLCMCLLLVMRYDVIAPCHVCVIESIVYRVVQLWRNVHGDETPYCNCIKIKTLGVIYICCGRRRVDAI